MESMLEEMRRQHEERETLKVIVIEDLLKMQPKSATHKELLNAELKVKMLTDQFQSTTMKLQKSYAEKALKDEVNEISNATDMKAAMEVFYQKLQKVKEKNKKSAGKQSQYRPTVRQEIITNLYGTAAASAFESGKEDDVLAKLERNLVDMDNLFTDEENYGRFLDLNESFTQFINLIETSIYDTSTIDYIRYLKIFDTFDHGMVPVSKKGNKKYMKYLEHVFTYLFNFVERLHPLMNLNEDYFYKKVRGGKAAAGKEDMDERSFDFYLNFEALFNEGQLVGWPKLSNPATSAFAAGSKFLDLSDCNSADDVLLQYGAERIKLALREMGLKCGGTPMERAARLFTTKAVPLDQLDKKLFAGGSKGSSAVETAVKQQQQYSERQKFAAYLEFKIAFLVEEFLVEQKMATVENVIRKQSLSCKERMEEAFDDEGELLVKTNKDDGNDGGNSSSDSDDDDAVPYNPKNLPLGWDGKPIPYWLYKLHGLSMYFSCEICGNFTYRGPKAFQMHFSEWRHAHGMRCLGIPNTAHFHNVTLIEDALALWQKIKLERQQQVSGKDAMTGQPLEEEYEDSQGNVVSKKTYNDLKRQGLL